MKFSKGLDFYWMGLIYIYSDQIYLSREKIGVK